MKLPVLICAAALAMTALVLMERNRHKEAANIRDVVTTIYSIKP